MSEEHFSYDPVGNRLSDNVTTGNWTYNQNNELQSFDTTSFKYNLNGQMTEKTVNGKKTTFSYNIDGRLKKIKDNNGQTVAQYEYDALGRRTKKYLSQTNETIYFHYSAEGLVAEYNETGQLIQSYGYKPNSSFTTKPVYTYRPDFTEAKGYAYYITDHLGTPKKLITNTGRKVWEASEDAFGQSIITNNEFRNPLRFPGQYEDEESSLRYNYHRYYDPSLGRYITSDPIGLEGGLNTYAYVENNPLNFLDPLGLSTWGYDPRPPHIAFAEDGTWPSNNPRDNLGGETWYLPIPPDSCPMGDNKDRYCIKYSKYISQAANGAAVGLVAATAASGGTAAPGAVAAGVVVTLVSVINGVATFIVCGPSPSHVSTATSTVPGPPWWQAATSIIDSIITGMGY